MSSDTKSRSANCDSVETALCTLDRPLSVSTEDTNIFHGETVTESKAEVLDVIEGTQRYDTASQKPKVCTKRVIIKRVRYVAPVNCNSELDSVEKIAKVSFDESMVFSPSKVAIGRKSEEQENEELQQQEILKKSIVNIGKNEVSPLRMIANPEKQVTSMLPIQCPADEKGEELPSQTKKLGPQETAVTLPFSEEGGAASFLLSTLQGSPIKHCQNHPVIPPSKWKETVGVLRLQPSSTTLCCPTDGSVFLSSPEKSSHLFSDSTALAAHFLGFSLTSEKLSGCAGDGHDVLSPLVSSPNDLSPFLFSNMQVLKVANTSRGNCDSSDATFGLQTPSPVPVTLAGARRHFRQKHLKRVSCYILGPLLGEGVFGVVRDAIETLGNRTIPPRFQRVAIKSFKHRRAGGSLNLLPVLTSAPAAIAAATTTTNQQITENTVNETAASFVRKRAVSNVIRHNDEKMQRLLENEVRNLQRFHCPNLIRGIDFFTRHGKDYVVLPIAICNLEQLVHETLRSEFSRISFLPKGVSHSGGQQSVGSRSLNRSPCSEFFIDASLGSCVSASEELSYRFLSAMDRTSSLLPARVVRGIMYQLLQGIMYLHLQGLAHNDLKPQNILLYADGVLKIADLGSVSEVYNDQGTPMYISPEVCRFFYCADELEDKGETRTVDALKNDMWSCGVILYYLLMGKPLWGCNLDVRNKYQLYREIAAQHANIKLDHVPEPDETLTGVNGQSEPPFETPGTESPKSFSSKSLLDLLRRLLDVNPETRLTAYEALQHPSLHMLDGKEHQSNTVMNTAQQDVSHQVLESPHMKALIKRDREQHLQFVAECCHVLGIAMPDEIFLPNPNNTSVFNEQALKNIRDKSNESHFRMPRGTVKRALFSSEEDFGYYERKLGKAEYDVRFILNNPIKVKMMEEYLLYTVLVECGYRTPEEAEAMRRRELQENQNKIIAMENKVKAGSSTGSSVEGRGGRPAKHGDNNRKTSQCTCAVI